MPGQWGHLPICAASYARTVELFRGMVIAKQTHTQVSWGRRKKPLGVLRARRLLPLIFFRAGCSGCTRLFLWAMFLSSDTAEYRPTPGLQFVAEPGHQYRHRVQLC